MRIPAIAVARMLSHIELITSAFLDIDMPRRMRRWTSAASAVVSRIAPDHTYKRTPVSSSFAIVK